MKGFSSYIYYSHNNPCGRENIEWSNFWYSNANKEIGRRILLVGDSTARMVRSTLEELSGIPIDMLGTSCGLHDIMFVKQVDAFFYSNELRYDTVFIQLGQHSNYNEYGELYKERDYLQYKNDLSFLVDYLREYTDNIILLSIFYAVVPLPKLFKLKPLFYIRHLWKEQFDWNIDVITKEKNHIIQEVAKEKGLKYLDINDHIIKLCQRFSSRLLHIDHIHFEEKAKIIIVREYMKLFKENSNESII